MFTMSVHLKVPRSSYTLTTLIYCPYYNGTPITVHLASGDDRMNESIESNLKYLIKYNSSNSTCSCRSQPRARRRSSPLLLSRALLHVATRVVGSLPTCLPGPTTITGGHNHLPQRFGLNFSSVVRGGPAAADRGCVAVGDARGLRAKRATARGAASAKSPTDTLRSSAVCRERRAQGQRPIAMGPRHAQPQRCLAARNR